MNPIYPQVCVKLSGQDGNVFNLISCCTKAAKKAGLIKEQIDNFVKEVYDSNGYDSALSVMMKYFTVL